jgi:large subunit ribosomal protein L13
MTGRKPWNKKYHTHSGYPGALKVRTFQHLMEKNPERILLNAVKGMLPKNKLRDRFLARLRIHKGTEHPYGSQKPEPVTLS